MHYGLYGSLHRSEATTPKPTLTRAEAINIVKWYEEARETASERQIQEQLDLEECLRGQPTTEELEADQAIWDAKLRASEKVYEDYREATEAAAKAEAIKAKQAEKKAKADAKQAKKKAQPLVPLPWPEIQILKRTRKETEIALNAINDPGSTKPHYTEDERERLLTWMSIPHPTSGTNFVWTNKVSKTQWSKELLAWDKKEGNPVFHLTRTPTSMQEFWGRWLQKYK
jgi:hypothetical protein